jgi:MFS family permease
MGGGFAYLAGCAVLLLPGVEPGGPIGPFVVARIFQGIGIAATLPAALSLVPRLVEPVRRGFGLAFVGSAHNLTLVIIPPLSLAVLMASSLHGVAVMATAFVVGGLIVVRIAPLPFLPASRTGAATDGPGGIARRRLGFAFRRPWASLIAIDLLFITHWGVVVAFLPQRAEAAGANVGLFFVADGVVILLARLPTGWLVDRMRPIVPIVIGLAATGAAVILLSCPDDTPSLVMAGCLSTGVGGALVITPLLVELSRRSGDADRAVRSRSCPLPNASARARQHRRGGHRGPGRVRARLAGHPHRAGRRRAGCRARRRPAPTADPGSRGRRRRGRVTGQKSRRPSKWPMTWGRVSW